MPKLSVQLVTALALAGLSLGNSSAPAEPPGIVTIADTQPEPITEAEDLPAPGEEPGSADSETDGTETVIPYQTAFAAPYLPAGGRPVRWDEDWYGYQNQGPWMRPIRRPIYRVPVQYARYWPTSYYTGRNNPRARYARPLPMVYQPTDTTQLGFYHQRVPQWQPRPGAIPGAPWPPNWHYTIPTRYGAYDSRGWNSGFGHAYGTGHHLGTEWCPEDEYQEPTPADPPAEIDQNEETQNAEPVNPVPVPDAPSPE